MDGTETGWGRPTESPPRWRALFDRARSGGRSGEPPEPEDDGADQRGNGGGLRAGRRSDGQGHRGWRDPGVDGAAPGRTGQPGFFSAPETPSQGRATPAADPAGDAPYPGVSRYAILENGYRPEPPPGESRYAILENGYRPPPPASPAPPVPPASGAIGSPGVIPGQPDRSGQTAPPAEHGFRPEPAYRRDARYPAPVERGYPPEPGYRALDRGYRSPIPTQPGPIPGQPGPGPTPPGPAHPRRSPPARPAPPPPVRKILDPEYSGRQRWGQSQSPGRTGRSRAELDRATAVLRRDLGAPRVLAFANPKGGVHKTTATVLAAATVGSVRGRGVLAWDDNELRGTLGLRAGSARHARTIRHLVADLIEVEALPGPQLIARLDDYLRHASDGSYDVLAGEESPRFAQRLDQHTVRRVLELLRRTHDVICVDTGNNVESSNWQTVLQAADQLVVTTVPREDAAFTADWMLDLLHEIGMSELADNAVTLLSCPTPGRSPLMTDLERHFATRTRAVVVVPYDPALETGSSIEYDQVQPETREAWLLAAATMLEPFAR